MPGHHGVGSRQEGGRSPRRLAGLWRLRTARAAGRQASLTCQSAQGGPPRAAADVGTARRSGGAGQRPHLADRTLRSARRGRSRPGM